MKMDGQYLRAMIGPMEGVMDAPLLKALFPLAHPACFVTPFLRVSEHPFSAKEIRRFLRGFPPGPPVLLQLMGRDAEKMAETAANAQACGVLGINLNFGCPSPQVVRGGAGGGVLRNPALLQRITAACVRAVPASSVSVKMRAGAVAFAELPELLSAVADAAPDFLILHPRTVAENYRAIPDMIERQRRAAELLRGRIPLVLNGDFLTAAQLHAAMDLPGVCGAMAARGILRDPFLLRRLSGESGLPEAEEGRLLLLAAAVRHSPGGCMPCGRLIGLVRLAFGDCHPLTDALKRQAVSGTESLSAARFSGIVRLFFAENTCNRVFCV